MDSKYIVCGEVSYDERMMEEPRGERSKERSASSERRNHSTMPSILIPQRVKKFVVKRKRKTKHIHLVWKEDLGYDKVAVQDIQQP